MDPFVGADVLAQRGHCHVADHSGIQGVGPLVGSRRCVRCPAVVLHDHLLVRDHVHGGEVLVGGVDHHRCRQAFEGSLAGHEHLPSPSLLSRRSEDADAPAGFLRHGSCCQAGAETGRGYDVVSAGVADARKRVVLTENPDLCTGGPCSCLERGLEAVCMALCAEAVSFERLAKPVVREGLLEAELGVLPDLV